MPFNISDGYRVEVLTAPASGVVSLDTVRAHLQMSVDQTADNPLLELYIEAASSVLEAATGRALVEQTARVRWDAPPPGRELRLPLGRCISVAEVGYVDLDNADQTVDVGDYWLELSDSLGARIGLEVGAQWPDTSARGGAFWVDGVFGYGAIDDVPASLRARALQLIADWYMNKETESLVTRSAIESSRRLVGPHKLPRV